ncbi:MAG: alpha/beta hydrolase [Candidatus Competibacterales bacterium]|nr:alpha/beta hydrolase [Candidatus Competibacterales bacterium]
MPEFLHRPDGQRLAYERLPGRGPGVVFLGGFMSDMTGSKALALEDWCRARGRAFVRFDYQGHGQSDGAFTDGTIGRWHEDSLAVLDTLTDGPQILVGSSMGGWMMLLAALARPRRIAALVGIAAAPDFTEDLIRDRLDPDRHERLARDGVLHEPSDYGPEPTPVTRRLLDEGREHLLLRGEPLPLNCPIRLLHGMRDPDVPWQTSLRIAERVTGEDVHIHLVKDGEHRLSREADLALLVDTLATLPGAGG